MSNLYDHVGSNLIELSINCKSNLAIIVKDASLIESLKRRLLKNLSKEIEECMLKSRIDAIVQLPELAINIESYPNSRIIKEFEEDLHDLQEWMDGLKDHRHSGDLPWMEDV